MLLALTWGLLFAGCASRPKVDWNSRVGAFNYDQAVTELGPPARETKLSDGRRVAEWVVGRNWGSAVTFGFGSLSSHTGVGVSQSVGSEPQDRILRLTFETDGKLAEWRRN
jgi:hypothetical protein